MIPTEEQRGTAAFDLEKAREAIEEAVDRLSQKIGDEDGPIWEKEPEKAAVLQTLLDEIAHLEKWMIKNRDAATELQYQLDDAVKENERLRADNAGLSKAVISIQEERDLAQAEFRAYHKAWEEQAIEIERLLGEKAFLERVVHIKNTRLKELESSLDEAEALTKKNADLMNAYLARIAELEDALVEGLTNFLHYRASCYDPARRCPYAKECDDCSTWDACGHVEKFRSEARQRLQAEGKIGPDARPKCDHEWQAAIEERGYQTCLKCGECRDIKDIPRTAPTWQITEERKAVILHCKRMLTFLKEDDAPCYDVEKITKDESVLVAMLEEAQ